jgi:hypothetical protein
MPGTPVPSATDTATASAIVRAQCNDCLSRSFARFSQTHQHHDTPTPPAPTAERASERGICGRREPNEGKGSLLSREAVLRVVLLAAWCVVASIAEQEPFCGTARGGERGDRCAASVGAYGAEREQEPCGRV